jgi:hypothetical protein
MNLFSKLVDIAAALLAILVILRITRGQLTKIGLFWPGATKDPGAHLDRP